MNRYGTLRCDLCGERLGGRAAYDAHHRDVHGVTSIKPRSILARVASILRAMPGGPPAPMSPEESRAKLEAIVRKQAETEEREHRLREALAEDKRRYERDSVKKLNDGWLTVRCPPGAVDFPLTSAIEEVAESDRKYASHPVRRRPDRRARAGASAGGQDRGEVRRRVDEPEEPDALRGTRQDRRRPARQARVGRRGERDLGRTRERVDERRRALRTRGRGRSGRGLDRVVQRLHEGVGGAPLRRQCRVRQLTDLPEYLYHGTSDAALPSISAHGLEARSPKRYIHTGSRSAISVAATESDAWHWARLAAEHEASGEPVVLRFPSRVLEQCVIVDDLATLAGKERYALLGCSVASEHIAVQVARGGTWTRLQVSDGRRPVSRYGTR